jgi:hypothetical protein
MSDLPVTAKGVNVTVSFDGKAVTIVRRKMTRSTEKRIPVSSITSVEWRQPGVRPGRIGFSLKGDDDDQEASFVKKSAGAFEALREAVAAAIGV